MNDIIDLSKYKHDNADHPNDADVYEMLKELGQEQGIQAAIVCYLDEDGVPRYYAAGELIEQVYQAVGLLERVKQIISENIDYGF